MSFLRPSGQLRPIIQRIPLPTSIITSIISILAPTFRVENLWYENYKYAKANDVSVIGGEAVTVGLGGGYTAGGGHSPLSSLYGLAADQVLALEGVSILRPMVRGFLTTQ